MAEHDHTTPLSVVRRTARSPARARNSGTPSPRTVRRAVDILAQLPAEVLGQLAEAIIDRLDASQPDRDREEDNEDGCPAEDVPLPGTLGVGEADDAEPDNDDEDDDPQGDGSGEDDPNFPLRDPGVLNAERDGLVTVRRRLREIVVVKSAAGRPVGVATMRARRFP